MSTSPIVTDQLHKHNTAVPKPGPSHGHGEPPMLNNRVWASVDVPSLNLSDPIGTTRKLPMVSHAAPAPLKNSDVVPTPKASTEVPMEPLDSGLAARLVQLRATSMALRHDVEDLRRTTGKLK